MLTAHARAFVSIAFEDREGNRRNTSLTFPFSLSEAQIHTYMDLWIDRIRGISNAEIRHYIITHTFEEEGESTADIDTDLYSYFALYLSNGSDYDCIWIPGAKRELLETEGQYAGVRLDAARPDVAAILLGLADITAFIVTPEGDPFPSTFVVGGLAV